MKTSTNYVQKIKNWKPWNWVICAIILLSSWITLQSDEQNLLEEFAGNLYVFSILGAIFIGGPYVFYKMIRTVFGASNAQTDLPTDVQPTVENANQRDIMKWLLGIVPSIGDPALYIHLPNARKLYNSNPTGYETYFGGGFTYKAFRSCHKNHGRT